MRPYAVVPLVVLVLLLPGCYHATVETGLTPSTETIEEPFASAWVYGLVPPSTIMTQMKCKHGVAKVETQLSFVNQLVGIITLGIYTPMDIKVTCAAAGTTGELIQPSIILPENAAPAKIQAALTQAADLAVTTGKPAYVRY
jgi:hypothetical protein